MTDALRRQETGGKSQEKLEGFAGFLPGGPT